MALKSTRFSGCHRLKKAALNSPALRPGASGEAVRIIQQALIDDGLPLPVSTKKYGSPDGHFGPETKAAVIEFQKRNDLKPDGIVGKKTMAALDARFPDWAPLPPPVAPTSYQVPGLKHPLKQPNPQTCWAVTYATLRSWKDGVAYDPGTAVAKVGPDYFLVWDRRTGLYTTAMKAFYRDAGLTVEPLQTPSVEGWVDLLRAHGMLLVGTSFDAADNSLHANLVWGMFGDGTVEGSQVAFIDPWTGTNRFEAFDDFHRRLLGVEVIEGGGLDDDQVRADWAQIVHY